jgi:hypothetical protein
VPIRKLTKEELKARLLKIVVGKERPPDESWRSGEDPVLAEATLEDCHETKVAVHEVFEQQRGDLRMVSATARVCQEEGMARLLADLLGLDLLPTEAFTIGEEVRDAHREYKGKPRKGKSADQRLKDVASTAKAKARQAAAKDPELAAYLEERLEEIDKVLATDRRMLASTVPPLSWPARNTVIHEPRQPTAAEATERAEAAKAKNWTQLEAAAKAAEAAAAAAERVAATAACDAERAEKSHTRLGPCPMPTYLNGYDLPRIRVNGKLIFQMIPDEEREYRLLEFERWAGSQELAFELAKAAREEKAAAREAREAAVDAREAADKAAAERKTAAEWAAEAEAHRLVAAHAQEQLAQNEAALARNLARIAELEREERATTRARLEADVERADWRTPAAACRVISLVGKSPDSVRTIGESRVISQQLTPAAERVELNRFEIV